MIYIPLLNLRLGFGVIKSISEPSPTRRFPRL
jgi:hypothetical protein